MNGERAAYNLWEVSETRLIDRVRRSEGLTKPYCCCENTTRSARTKPCLSGRFGAPASAVRFPLPVPNSKFACEHAHMSTRVLAGLTRGTLEHALECSRYGHLMDTQYRKGQAALSMTASAGRNCVDKRALCLVASSLSTSHASSSFFLASEAAFSRAPKRPLAIVLVTSPNLYSLLPVASRTAPSKPLMAPRVKSPNS